MSNFPNALDTDLEIPRIDDDVTEMTGDTINLIRDAIFNIESNIGIGAHGNKTNLVDRIDVSIDEDGIIKRSALIGVGLVALPIDNSQIASDAAIEESKLDLDFSTQSLRNAISSLQTSMAALQSGSATLSSRYNRHVLGQDEFHDGTDITLTGVAGLVATNVGDGINEISEILLTGTISTLPHIDTSLPDETKHMAEHIGVDTVSFEVIDSAANTAQKAFDALDAGLLSTQATHVDGFHANGIFKEVNSGTSYNSRKKRFGPISGVTYTKGSTIVTATVTSAFVSMGVNPGDILEIVSQTGIIDSGTYKIRAVGPVSATEALGALPELTAFQLSIFHIFSETITAASDVEIYVYAPVSESSDTAPLACAVRTNDSIVDTITVLNPGAARVVSKGFNGAILNENGGSICIAAGVMGATREITITGLHLDRLGTNRADPVTAQSVAEKINAFVSDPTNPAVGYHFPISAFPVGNEIAIAHNMVGVDYPIRILDGYSGNYAMGFDELGADVLGKDAYGNIEDTFSVNGTSLNSIKTLFSGTGIISNPSLLEIEIYDGNGVLADPAQFGISIGSVMHLTGHTTLSANGSYTISSVNTGGGFNVSVFAGDEIPDISPAFFNVLFTDSHISLQSLSDAELSYGLLEIGIDQDGYVLTHQRATYDPSLASAGFEIVDISDNFPAETNTVVVTANGFLMTIVLNDGSLSGPAVTINNRSTVGGDYFHGTFKLYHSNGVDYLVLKVVKIIEVTGPVHPTVTTSPSLNKDEVLELCKAHFNGSNTITNISDTRLFGNLGAQQIRDDFIEIFSERPTAELRSDGVIRGFDLLDIPKVDSESGLIALPLSGGVAYVGGIRCEVETQKVILPITLPSGGIIGDGYRTVGINEFGSLVATIDELGELLSDGYSTDSRFGKILPLYYVHMIDNTINCIIDIRLYINNLDSKLDLVVDETNSVVGSFRSLDGALVYAKNFPNNEKLTIRIVGEISPLNGKIIVPQRVSLIGDLPYGGGICKIKNTMVGLIGEDFITLQGDNRLANIEIVSNYVALEGSLVAIDGSSIVIERCKLGFNQGVTTPRLNTQDFAIKINSGGNTNVSIINNKVDTVYSGIVSNYGCNNLRISGNEIINLYSDGSASAFGISVGSSAIAIDNVFIENNDITVPSNPASDIIGIAVDPINNIGAVKITGNNILHSNSDTMTCGIRINRSSGAGTCGKLIISHNIIDGIQHMDSNIYGIHVSYVGLANIVNNVIKNIGNAATYADCCFIRTESVGSVIITGNNLNIGHVQYGIYGLHADHTQKALIANNIITSIGSDATGIDGDYWYSSVMGNTITGPGDIGIRWAGIYSKISENNLNSYDPGIIAAFTSGIRCANSDIEVTNNTLTGMYTDSIGIANFGNYARVKIDNNAISGDSMTALIDMRGADCSVCGNRLYHTTDNNTYFIRMISLTDSTIANNMLSVSSATTTDDATCGIYQEIASSVSNCDFRGNIVPDGLANLLGDNPAPTVVNTNRVALNKGVIDTVGIAACEGINGGGPVAWTFTFSGTSYWETTVTQAAYLIFPLNKVPNGTQLVYVDVSGSVASGVAGCSLTATVYRKSMTTSAENSMSNMSVSGTTAISFGPGHATTGRITVDTTDDYNIVNYAECNYYVLIDTAGATSAVFRVDGLTLHFR